MFIIVINVKGILGYICFIKKFWYVCLINISDNFNNKGLIVLKLNCVSVIIFYLFWKGLIFKKWKHYFMFFVEINEYLKIGSILFIENYFNFFFCDVFLFLLFLIL